MKKLRLRRLYDINGFWEPGWGRFLIPSVFCGRFASSAYVHLQLIPLSSLDDIHPSSPCAGHSIGLWFELVALGVDQRGMTCADIVRKL